MVFRETQPETYRPEAIKEYLKNKFRAVPAHAGVSSIRGEYENPLWILLALTGLVLLIASANLANLLLAQASAREREVALRQAIGASRARLVGQLMSESLLLAGCGAVLGGSLAYLLSHGLVLFLSSGGQQLNISLGLDWRVLGFTATVALVTCLLFGLAPAIRATRIAPAEAIRGGRGSTSTSERSGLRRALVVSQIAFSLVLLVGALLFGQSLRNLLSTDTGIDSDGVMVAAVDTKLPNLEPERRSIVFQQLLERIEALPDVTSTAAVLYNPFYSGGWNEGGVRANDNNDPAEGKLAWFNVVSPGYFQTMHTPLLAGRDFSPHDDQTAPMVAIVNEKFVQEVFGGGDPIGRTFRYEGDAGETDPVYQVAGLVSNTKYSGLREDTRSIVFLPMAQMPAPARMRYVIRARGSFGSVMAGVRRQMAEINRGLLVEFQMLDLQMAQSVLRERLMANLSGGFGVLAALLSTLGLYGVMSYMVARRRNEIGVRMALGAKTVDILSLVFDEAWRLLLIGLALGLGGSLALSRYAESLLFGLKPNDALTLALGCVLLAATAFAAALIPARRAACLDPTVVLRDE